MKSGLKLLMYREKEVVLILYILFYLHVEIILHGYLLLTTVFKNVVLIDSPDLSHKHRVIVTLPQTIASCNDFPQVNKR